MQQRDGEHVEQAASSHQPLPTPAERVTTYVLVPGAGHGAWCWSEVVPLLERAGHRVLTPELVGKDDIESPVIERPLAIWADRIAAILRAETDPVVLVGHSRAGLVISEVAERVPEKVDLLIYLTAFLLEDGQTLQDVAQQAPNAASFSKAIISNGNMLGFRAGDARRFLYNRTPEHLVQRACDQMVPEPAASFITPIHVSEERFGTVPRAYIECVDDQAILLETQQLMQTRMRCSITERLNSDHSPFFSMPAELVETFRRCVDHRETSRSQA